MKKIILIILVLPTIAFAQFNKGQIYLNGQVTGGSQNTTGNGVQHSANTNSFSVSSSIGFFISDKWSMGILLGASSSYSKNAGSFTSETIETSSFGLAAGVHTRRYFVISENFFFALEARVSFERGGSSVRRTGILPAFPTPITYDVHDNRPTYDVLAGLRPFFVFFPSPKWGFEAGLGSLSIDHFQYLSDHAAYNQFNASGLGMITIGVTKYFGRKAN